MWYFYFNSPEEFISYQDKLIENWKRYSQYGIMQQSELYRATGRTTCEYKCIRTLLQRGETVIYVVSKVYNATDIIKNSKDDIVNESNKNLTILSFNQYVGSNINISSIVEKHYVIFDHYILESQKYPYHN